MLLCYLRKFYLFGNQRESKNFKIANNIGKSSNSQPGENSDFHSELRRWRGFKVLEDYFIFQFFGGETIRRRNNSRPGARAKISGSWPYNSTNLCFSLLYRAFATSNWGPSSYTSDREVKTGIVSSSMFPAITSSWVLHTQKTLEQKETKKPKIQSNNKSLSQKNVLQKNIQTNTCWHKKLHIHPKPQNYTPTPSMRCFLKKLQKLQTFIKIPQLFGAFWGSQKSNHCQKKQTNHLVFTKV
jgi:hypothetical protein